MVWVCKKYFLLSTRVRNAHHHRDHVGWVDALLERLGYLGGGDFRHGFHVIIQVSQGQIVKTDHGEVPEYLLVTVDTQRKAANDIFFGFNQFFFRWPSGQRFRT